MKIALVFPRMTKNAGEPPIGVASLAACLREWNKAEVRIIDSSFTASRQYLLNEVTEFGPDLCGIYVNYLMADDAITLARQLRGSVSVLVAGGPLATVMPELLADHFDAVFLGEAEQSLSRFISATCNPDGIDGIYYLQDGKTVHYPKTEFIPDLDQLPFPAYDLLDMERYISNWIYLDRISLEIRGTDMITSRGCPYSCTYCQPTLRHLFGTKIRRRSPGNVVAEIITLQDQFRLDAVSFEDDTFIIDEGWVREFCAELQRRKVRVLWRCNIRADLVSRDLLQLMYDSGLRDVHMGVETASERIRNEVYKKRLDLSRVDQVTAWCREIGIIPMGFFMLGGPGETTREIRETIAYAAASGLLEATFNIAKPIPGSDLRRQCANLPGDFSQYDYYKANYTCGQTPLPILWFLHKYALTRFYLTPKRIHYIFRHVTSLHGWQKLFRKVQRFF